MGNFNRIVYTPEGGTEISLGYHEWISYSYEGNTVSKIIPRAKGVVLYSGDEMGGGTLKIKVQVFIVKDTREELEMYILDLIQNCANTIGTLVISRGALTETLTDCYIDSIAMPDDCNKTATISMEFTKSL